MKLMINRCDRFKVLASEALDRELTLAEERFVVRHRQACDRCRMVEQNQHLALNMLRASALSPEPAESFDRRVIRRVKVQSVREKFGYWSPAAIGATIATVLVLSLLQIVARPASLPERMNPVGEARRDNAAVPAIPNLAPESRSQ